MWPPAARTACDPDAGGTNMSVMLPAVMSFGHCPKAHEGSILIDLHGL
jgi:hypothetical protein